MGGSYAMFRFAIAHRHPSLPELFQRQYKIPKTEFLLTDSCNFFTRGLIEKSWRIFLDMIMILRIHNEK